MSDIDDPDETIGIRNESFNPESSDPESSETDANEYVHSDNDETESTPNKNNEPCVSHVINVDESPEQRTIVTNIEETRETTSMTILLDPSRVPTILTSESRININGHEINCQHDHENNFRSP